MSNGGAEAVVFGSFAATFWGLTIAFDNGTLPVIAWIFTILACIATYCWALNS